MKYWILVLLFLLPNALFARVEQVKRSDYLTYIYAAAESSWASYDEDVARWKENIDLKNIWGYSPPGFPTALAAVSGYLYQLTGEENYAKRAIKLLAAYPEFKKAYPADFHKTRPEYRNGIPAIPSIFTMPTYLKAYAYVRDSKSLGSGDRQKIEQAIAESADYQVTFQEWGPMNRAMLRAELLVHAARLVPDHPHSDRWMMMGRAIGDDNWGKWEIEDATGYHGIWVYSLMGYASYALKDESLYRTPVWNYYFQYYLNLMCPGGNIPDFGDASWKAGWIRFIPFFEKGATVYHDPHLKWASNVITRTMVDLDAPRKSLGLAYFFTDCHQWATDELIPEEPDWGSREVLEDVVGKKFVFRNGWAPKSTYMLVNYRDEGDGGRIFRDYLRDTIPVEEEKMHHGHADEGSIVMLMDGGSLLLHDGGYREYMPSGPYGAYRQDYFHNRVAVRKGKMWKGQPEGAHRYSVRDEVPGQALMDFYHDSGAYRKVRTQKMDFLTLDHYDMSWTRVTDEKLGYQWDRVINWVKDLNAFVVFDAVKFLEEDFLTMANLWHTQNVLAQGPGWYVTRYDSLPRFSFPDDRSLLVFFPETARKMQGVEPEKRHYQDELVIFQAESRHGYVGETELFTTVLVPLSKGDDGAKWRDAISMVDVDARAPSLGVQIDMDGKRYLVGAKLDLEREMVNDWRRPKYTYEAGKVRFGDYETNASNLFVVEEGKRVHFAAVNAFRLRRKDQTLWEQQAVRYGLAFDGSNDALGTGKVRYWQEEVNVK